MKKNLITVLKAIITTSALVVSYTFAQGNIPATTTALDFFGDVSIRVYCTFSKLIPGADNSACATDILMAESSESKNSSLSNATGSSTLTDTKLAQIGGVVNRSIATTLGGRQNVVYVPGPKGADGKNGTTTIVYQTSIIPGANGISPTAYIYAGGNTNTNPYQTTVPGDIHSTFIHFLTTETIRFNSMWGGSAEIANITASSTNTNLLNFATGTGGTLTISNTTFTNNLVGTSSTVTDATSTNFFATNASITNATTTNLFSAWINALNIYVDSLVWNNATGTNLQVANASTTNFSATGTSFISELYLASSTQVNSSISSGNATLTTLVSDFSTSTDMFALRASITEATTTYFFAAWANFLNLLVSNLQFDSATGTNLQVANASTTNFSATGTSVLANALVSSSTLLNTTIQNGEIKAGNATVTSLVSGNSTSTKIFATNASVTNATSTNLFAALFRVLNATIDNLAFTNATGTKIQLANLLTTNINATGTATITNAIVTNGIVTNATITNATITNLRVTNCAEGNVLCNGGNDTGAIVGTDAPVIIGSLNAANLQFITGDLGAPSVTPGLVKLTIETGLPAEGSGAVRVTNDLKVGANIVASGTATVTNLVATGTFQLATGTIASTTVNWLTATRGILTNATITNATATKIFATNASITNATTTNFFAAAFRALNMTLDNLFFLNATGTNLQVANASTTNFSATGTSVLSNAKLASSTLTNTTIQNGEIKAGNATVTSLVSGNSTTTNFFATLFKSLNASIDSFLFANATGTTMQLANLSTTNLSATGTATITNLFASNSTTTNLSVVNIGTTFGNATITMNASLVPSASSTFDLGSALLPWRDLWVSSSTVHIGGNSLSSTNGTILWNGAPIAIASTTGSSTFKALVASTTLASTTIADAMIADKATFSEATSTNLFASVFTGFIGMINELVTGNATITNATTTNLYANNFVGGLANFINANFGVIGFGLAVGDIVQTGAVNTTVVNATGTSVFAGLIATNATITNATLTNATFTKIYADVVQTDVVDYKGITGTNATITNATVTNALVAKFSADDITTQTLVINGSMTVNGNIQLATSDSSVNDFGTGDRTHNNYGNGVEVTNVLGSDTGENFILGSSTVSNINSLNIFAQIFAAVNATIDSLTSKIITTESLYVLNDVNALVLNASTTNASTTNTIDLFAKNIDTDDFEARSFGQKAKSIVEELSIATTSNGITFDSLTNTLTSIVNGKSTSTSLASLVGGGPSDTSIALRQLTATSTVSDAAVVDHDLKFKIGPNEKWIVQIHANIRSGNLVARDVQMGVSNTAVGGECNYGIVGPVSSPSTSDSCEVLLDTDYADSVNAVRIISGVVTSGPTGGEVALVYATQSPVVPDGEAIVDVGSTLVAYKVTGADLAEVYYSKDSTVEEGDVVALDGSGISQVMKSEKKYQKNVLGIVSTKPGLVMGEADGTGKVVVVGLSGRVPVKVTTANGEIKAGDFLTSSNVPGVAMRATGAGQVIGQALTNYSNSDVNSIGKVYVFIKNTYHDGNSDEDTEETLADKFTLLVKNTIEKLTDVYLNMTLAISSVKANDVSANRVSVQQFCVGQTCFSESDMQEFRTYLDEKKNKSQEVVTPTPVITPQEPVVVPEPVVSDQTESEPVVTEPVLETEVTPEAVPVVESPETTANVPVDSVPVEEVVEE